MSNKDIRDIFYTIMDGIVDIKRRQDRIEDRLRRVDERTHILELWTIKADQKMQPQTSGCPSVPPTRYCEVCFVAGHQASHCRSKARMDADHVRKIYEEKNICVKCHRIHN
uniref:DUF1758 domain-containing protein n=1 Tax=Haemonchus contortus TaxID=6289 RepID=A0A7I4YFA7_HAECO